MKRIMLKSKVHRATVTGADLEYEGSLTLDARLMEEANLIPYEQIHVFNISNGERFITYLIEGDPDSGVVIINGAAAKKAGPGDMVIIVAYGIMDEDDTDSFEPKVLLVNEKNRIIQSKD